MTTLTTLRLKALDRRALEPLADWLAVAVAVSLPWSTTATGILIVLWLLAVLPTWDIAAVRRELATAAGGLPVLLWGLATVGLFWADVSWSERLSGYGAFHRLLVIPLLLAQFRRSDNGLRVLTGFFASVTVLLALSWLLALFPSLPWHTTYYGVPVKDYILQSDDFLMCALVLFGIALDRGRGGRWRSALALSVLGILFIANIAFVATGRTTLLVAPVLLLMLGWRQYRWKGLAVTAVLLGVIGIGVGLGSPYLRARMIRSVNEWRGYETRGAVNSTSLHFELLKRSLSIVRTAPIIGHGTGSIPEQFRETKLGNSGISSVVSVNPHDQILAIGIQLGSVGIIVLLAMWAAHFMLFRGSGLIPWIGTILVTENVVSSLVNSHLFDFTQAWIYIFGVGAAGGSVLRARSAGRSLQPAVHGEPQLAEGDESDPVTA